MKTLIYAEIIKNGNTVRKVVGEDLNTLDKMVSFWRQYHANDRFTVKRLYRVAETEDFQPLDRKVE